MLNRIRSPFRKPAPTTFSRRIHLLVEQLEDRYVPSAVIATDHLDYHPGTPLALTGSGFQAGETVNINVVANNGSSQAIDGAYVVDANGHFVATWTVDARFANSTMRIVATGSLGDSAVTFATDESGILSISGTKFLDTDHDGVHDSGESGIAGWTVYLSTDLNYADSIAHAVTSSTGSFTFTTDQAAADGVSVVFAPLDAGTQYYVFEGPPTQAPLSGWTQSLGGGTAITIDPTAGSVTNQTTAYSIVINPQSFQFGTVSDNGILVTGLDTTQLQVGWSVEGGAVLDDVSIPDGTTIATIDSIDPVAGTITLSASLPPGDYFMLFSAPSQPQIQGIDFGNYQRVSPPSPRIQTFVSADTATVGTAIHDTADVMGGDNPTGTVTFNLYDSATGMPVFTDANEPLIGGEAVSHDFITKAAGSYYWVAAYSGDGNNTPVTSGAGDELVTITPATPMINTTQQPATAVVGSSIADLATVSGGYNPTGTVTFNLYDNPNGTGTPLFVSANVPLDSNGFATSASYVATAAGTDYWVATYNGDGNNVSVTSNTSAEPVIVTPKTPTINTVQQPASVLVGSSIADKAAVGGGYNLSGTVTFKLYNNPNGTGTPLFVSANVPLDSNGVATSASYLATAAGTDYWVAIYNGDGNNVSVTSNTSAEPVIVTPKTPTINTVQQPASVLVGSSIADQATVGGGYNLSGTVTFNLYDNPNGTSTPLFISANVPLDSNGVATSASYVATAAGTDYWVATYNGDGNNVSVTSNTSAEPVIVTPKTPTINTVQQPASVLVGSSIADKATVGGGYNLSGTVTFKLYNNPNGTGTPLFVSANVPLDSNGVATSASYLATAAGTDYWVATYNGDGNNVSVTSGVANEPVTVTPQTPTIATYQQPATATVGSSIADKAVVSGGYNPTGTVTFKLYNNANGTGTPLVTFTNVALVSGVATSPGYTAMATGTDYWVAIYNGDSNNSPVTSPASAEPVVISPGSPAISTTPSQTSTPGGVVAGQFATIGFWHNQNGQAVINSFNGGPTSTALGNWLATNFPNLFGSASPYLSASLAGKTNAQVASAYLNLWTPSGVVKNTYVQAFAVALGLYADTSSLGGASLVGNGLAAQYGFVVTASGAGTISVGNDGPAFGVTNGSSLSVLTILQTVNGNFSPSTGQFSGGDQTKTSQANDVLNNINSSGDIPSNGSSVGTTGLKLMDSATLSGGVNPTGTITFYLFAPGATSSTPLSSAVYSDVVTIGGNGTYTTSQGSNPGGFVPTAAGTYQWVAIYSGDNSNSGATSPFGSEPWNVGVAGPAINTIDGGTVILGSGTKLTDLAQLAGGSNPTGTITFYLLAPGATSSTPLSSAVYSTVVTVTGNGTYTTSQGSNPGGYLPGSTGTYQWVAVYSGDSKNAPVASAFGDEPEAVTPGAPSISTTPGGPVVLGGITISGIKYQDMTGNGFAPGNTQQVQGGVTVFLYKESNGSSGLQTSDTLVTSAVTSSNGSYSFTNLSPGTYYVQEDVPDGYIQTGGGPNGASGNTYYTISATTGNSYAGLNFDDFMIPTCQPTCVTYTVIHSGYSQTFSTLAGNTHPGDTVRVNFTVAPGMSDTLSLVSYYAPSATFSDSTAYKQKIYQQATGTFAPGNYSLTVQIPNCYYQIDFICGLPLTQLEPNQNNNSYGPDSAQITYHAEGRFIDSDSGGTTAPTTLNTQIPTPPVVTTTTSTQVLTDSATLSGGTSPGGTITFYLMAPGATSSTPLTSAVYKDIVTISGNGTYTTAMGSNPGGFVPTATGTYQWVAVYSGDSNNASLTSPFGSEPEVVTSSISISGTKYLDITGNGFGCGTDAPQGGVTIKLYKESNGTSGFQSTDTFVTSTVTASDGTYSFGNLMPGITYYVQEAVPNGYIQTGGGPNGSVGNTYYTVSAAPGQSYTGNDFADFMIPTCVPTCVTYNINDNGCKTTVSDLRGNTNQGQTVTVTFTVPAGMSDELTLVSYIAPSATFSNSNAYQQVIYQQATGVFSPGTYSLTVAIPNCYYQIDFICGKAICQLQPNQNNNAYGPDSANILYGAQSRLLSADNDGTQAFTTNPVVAGGFSTAGFWSTTTGQNVLKALNGGSSSTNLGRWLATSFPNLYGAAAGTHSFVNSNGTYFSNSSIVSALTAGKFKNGDLQVLSAALSVYATSINLAGTNIRSIDSKFVTSLAGSGMYTYNVGTNGAAFGLPNSSTVPVMLLLNALNGQTLPGAAVSSGANTVFSGINVIGNVANADLSYDGVAYGPAQVRTAYGINNLSLDGTGQTIAIVDAYDNPNIAESLDAFSSQFSLTAGGPTIYDQYGAASSYLTVLGQDGSGTLPDVDPAGQGHSNWELEAALDVEWVHAMAPGAQIILVEANSQSLADLMTAVQTAAALPNVSVVSMSWGFAEGQTVLAADEAMYDSYLTTPAGHTGVTFVASTGDYGTANPEYPAYSPNVVAVGGTSLLLNGDNSYQSETGWGAYNEGAGAFLGGGGGASMYEMQPTYQLGVQTTGYRTTPDVSFVADPSTGVWVVDTYNLGTSSYFEVAGGTSVSAPAWAGLLALANQGRMEAGLSTLGSDADPTATQQALYSVPGSDYNAVTTGFNGFSASEGYNLVGGIGTPAADRLIPDLVGYTTPIDFAANAGNATVTPATIASATSMGSGGEIANAVVFNAVIASPLGRMSAPTSTVDASSTNSIESTPAAVVSAAQPRVAASSSTRLVTNVANDLSYTARTLPILFASANTVTPLTSATPRSQVTSLAVSGIALTGESVRQGGDDVTPTTDVAPRPTFGSTGFDWRTGRTSPYAGMADVAAPLMESSSFETNELDTDPFLWHRVGDAVFEDVDAPVATRGSRGQLSTAALVPLAGLAGFGLMSQELRDDEETPDRRKKTK